MVPGRPEPGRKSARNRTPCQARPRPDDTALIPRVGCRLAGSGGRWHWIGIECRRSDVSAVSDRAWRGRWARRRRRDKFGGSRAGASRPRRWPPAQRGLRPQAAAADVDAHPEAVQLPGRLVKRPHPPHQPGAHRHRDRKPHPPPIQVHHQGMVVECAVGAQKDPVHSLGQRRQRALDHTTVAALRRDVAVPELVGHDRVLLRPQRQQALAHLRRRQAPLATLVRNRPVNRRSRARAAKVLDQRRHAAVRRHRPKTDLAIQLKVQTRPRHRTPNSHPTGETHRTHNPPNTNVNPSTPKSNSGIEVDTYAATVPMHVRPS